MRLRVMAGAGNSFAVVDTRSQALPDDLPGLARSLCARAWEGRLPALDGLLLVSPGTAGGDCRMKIYNSDGSSPEACGNGLRCVAKFAREEGLARRDQLRVETDAGLREVELVRHGDEISGARARMGAPRRIESSVELATSRGRLLATLVDMGNPHCVLFVEDERAAAVHELGREIEYHPRFPKRTNVEFAALRNERLFLRVWERGVGETAACGTGACATAVAAAREERVSLPIDVELSGGRLTVDWDGRGEVVLTGPCEDLWSGVLELAGEVRS